MAEVARGEIWQFAFPRPDRRRPVLVLMRQDMIGRLSTVTVAPLTTTIRGVASEVVVGTEVGLKQASAVNLHHVATVPRAGLRAYVGTVPGEVMQRVCDALLFFPGIRGTEGRVVLGDDVAVRVDDPHARQMPVSPLSTASVCPVT